MSTKAAIIVKNDNIYRGIYCHWDGYPEYVGEKLNLYYKDFNKINELIDLGDISCLGERVHPIGENHSYDNPEENTTIAYCRDRGERHTEAVKSELLNEILGAIDHNYAYLFENGAWYLIKGHKKENLNDYFKRKG